MLNRGQGRRRQNSTDSLHSNHSIDPNNRRMDAGDGDINVNDADFLPANPISYDRHERQGVILNQIKDMLCIFCQATFIILCLYTLVVLNKVQKPDEFELFSTSASKLVTSQTQKLPEQEQQNVIQLEESKERHLLAFLGYQMEALKLRQRELRFMCAKMKVQELAKISSMIREATREAINLYNADKTGLIDFALESSGGAVVSTPDTQPYENHVTFSILGLVNVHSSSNPRFVINPDTHPGQCFAFRGATGRVRLRLSENIKVTAVTLEHVDPRIVTDTGSAPKDFKVFGLNNEREENGDELGQFTYRIGEGTVQTFPIEKAQQDKRFGLVELNILTNYGNPNYTCVYRFRVHGR